MPTLELSTRALAHSSPAWYAYITSGGLWVPAPHLLMLSEWLVDVAEGRRKRIIVEMPPRHGKSVMISEKFPQWYMGRFPDRQVILASYSGGLTRGWSSRARDGLAEHGPWIFGVGVDPKRAANNRWGLVSKATGRSTRGGLIAAGVRSGITGRGADLFVIDDPIKDDKEANSKSQRKGVIEWFRSTASTRLEPNSAMIVLMTRWHEGDLAGFLQHEMATDAKAEQWDVLSLPAICEVDNDQLGRKEGEALWPERFDESALEDKKRRVGSYWWNALYQQHPSAVEGAVFKRAWFHYFEIRNVGGREIYCLSNVDGHVVQRWGADVCTRFCTMDLAITVGNASDWTVLSTWAITPDKQLLLLDVERHRLEGPDQVTLAKAVYQRWRPSVMWVEGVQYQQSFVQHALRAGLPTKAIYPDRDKHSRAMLPATYMEAGRIYFRRGAAWLSAWEDELLSFIAGKEAEHDDQVDTLSYAALQLAPSGGRVYRL
jgi:predicted phage terminase large subunit-like protein